ncbi:MAG TPA: PilZ domain-containing protein [Anaerolineae bacterium]|nr:PilZ domain-containing protein [Anaerolineae bacterium]
MKDDKRKRTRVHFKTQVVLKTDISKIKTDAKSSDISMKGMFISTDEKIPAGTPCDIEIVLSGTTSKLALNIEGVIARQDKEGIGITFNSMDVDSYFHLKNIVMYNASDPDAVEEEMFS